MIVRATIVAWMSVVFAGFVAAETRQNGSEPLHDARVQQRSLSAIRADATSALIAEAKSRRLGSNTPQVLRLVELYREMAAHSQRDTSDSLKELGQQVRSRLVTIRDRIERKLSDQNRSSKTQKVARSAAGPESRVLAQQLAPPGVARIGQGVAVAGIPRPVGTASDYGPELVELIEATISSATWNVNGGNGSIVYFAPFHALVVSAPDEVHGQIGGVLGQLHAAQREIDGVQVVAEVGAVRARN